MQEGLIVRCRELISREIDGEVILISNDGRHMHLLNETASLIWNAADGNTSVTGIISRLCEEYDVDKDKASQDAISTVKAMREKHIVRIESEDAV